MPWLSEPLEWFPACGFLEHCRQVSRFLATNDGEQKWRRPFVIEPETKCGMNSEYLRWSIGQEAKRAFDAIMGMKKIDVATIKAARRG